MSRRSEVSLREMCKTNLCLHCYEVLMKSTKQLIRMCKMLPALIRDNVRVRNEFETSSRGDATRSDKRV